LAGLVEPMQVRHCWIAREETVERQGWRCAIELEGVVAAQLHPIGIADRRHGGKPVERAAQHDGEEARIAAFRARSWARRPRRTARPSQAAARGGLRREDTYCERSLTSTGRTCSKAASRGAG
jgi:hypothetical protein